MARKLTGLLAAGLALAVLAGCKPHTDSAEPAQSILRISQRNEPADLDPATASLPDEFFIIRALGEGLLRPDPAGGAPLPAAAVRWEVSPDGLTYTFHLRPGALWSNSEPVTAADFIASYRRLLMPATAAPKAALFFMVKNARAFATGRVADFSAVGFAAPDPSTLVVTLEHPMAQFPVYAASGPWIPVNPDVVEKFGRDWTKPGNYVGNGPFVLSEWRPHQRISVRRNVSYHDPAAVRLDGVAFVRADDNDTEERAYRAGQLDVTMTVPQSKLETYARERPAELHRQLLAETRYLAFNTSRPPLSDRRVRQALSLALNRTELVSLVLRGGQEPAYRLLPPALRPTGDAAPHLTATPAEDVAAARRLLAEAGFPDGRDFPKLELSTWSGSPVVEAIQATWKKELGIEVGLLTRDAKVHQAALREGAYDIGFMTAIPDVADAGNLLADFVSGSPANYPHWSDATYDQLLRRAQAASDPATRSALLRAAEQRLMDEQPLAPLYFNAHNWLMQPTVRHWQEDALWVRDYLGTSLDAP
ncbi:MAG: peptide ABC transporter substrate-binding protein [Verrucomicrobia bacterium]|nr:peptide ABC transporter substrate-binding protein [Verrucomicrobiota bacterium]